ncbi:MAG: hypothetical protein ACT4PM_03960 [Gemmatimonadales bacterium]
MTKSRWGAMVLLIGTFVLGGLVGGALTSWGEKQAHEKERRHRPRPTYVERLSQDLNLTDSQRVQIQAVLDRNQPGMDSLWARIRQEYSLDSARQAIRQQVMALLTPEQKATYTAIIQRQQRQDSLRRAGQERKGNGNKR